MVTKENTKELREVIYLGDYIIRIDKGEFERKKIGLDDRIESPWKRAGATYLLRIMHLEEACIGRNAQSRFSPDRVALALPGPALSTSGLTR